MSVEVGIPFLIGHCRLGFLFGGWLWGITLLFEEQNILKVKLYNSITRMGETTHYSPSPCSIHSRSFLPDNLPHKVKAYRLTKADNLRMYRNYFITTVIYRSSKLVSYIDTETTTIMKHTITLFPYQIQMIYIILIGIIEAYLFISTIVFQLPIRR